MKSGNQTKVKVPKPAGELNDRDESPVDYATGFLI